MALRTLAERSIIPSGSSILHATTIVLDSQMSYVETVSWQDAMTNIIGRNVNVLASYSRELGNGVLQEVRVNTGINPQTGVATSYPLPFMVAWEKMIYYPYAAFKNSHSNVATKRAILTRDKFTCAYQHNLGRDFKGRPSPLVDLETGAPLGCEYKADTVDHVLPQSRRGGNTWTNLVAACKWCNNYKADRTPEEAGMRLLWEPYMADESQKEDPAEIWDYLNELSGAQ